MNNQFDAGSRLEGLDFARFLALAGMVIVNFNVVMVTADDGGGRFSVIAELLQGRAAATFVVLAGVGLGLSALRHDWDRILAITVRRAAFLLVVGLLNLLIFDADIIHYYAFYFLLGVLFLRAANWVLFVSMLVLIAGFVGLIFFLDYNTGWNWQTLSYSEIWTPAGFLRNLVFNGWHPLVPWFAFLLLGILLSRLSLRKKGVQLKLLIGGSLVFSATILASHELMLAAAGIDPEAVELLSTKPMPPMPLYMLSGGSIACAIVGFCLLLESLLRLFRLLHIFTTPGRQTLTLYVAHIVIGMGTLEVLGMIGGKNAQTALVAAVLFMLAATGYALAWARCCRRGPLETLMRKIAG